MKTKMKIKMAYFLIPALLAALCLAGCESTYEESEDQELTAAGRAVLESWLQEETDLFPEAEILSCTSDIFQYPGNVRAHLTGYVSGEIQSGEETTGYTVCPATSQVYLDADMDFLADTAYDYILSCLELEEIEEIDQYSVTMELPYAYEGSSRSVSLMNKRFTYGRLPADLALQAQDAAPEDFREALIAYLADPDNMDCLGVNLQGKVSDEVDFDRYDLPYIQEREKQNGLYFSNFYFWHKDESVNGAAWLVESERRDWIEKDGLKLRALMSMRSDLADSREPEGILRERYTYDEENIGIQETEEGWQITFLNDVKGPCFYLYAPEDHPMRAHDYTLKTEDDEQEVHWEYDEDVQAFALVNVQNAAWYFSQPADLTIR